MKVTIFLSCLVFVPALTWAAEPLPVGQSELNTEMAKVVLGQERTVAFQKAMKGIPSSQQETFWEIYKTYSQEKAQLDEVRLTLFGQYMTNYLLLTNDQALELMNRLIRLQEDELKLRVKTFKLLSKKASPLVATRFYQVDDYIQASLKLDALNRIPIFGDPIK